jgi:ketopantoate reductase
METEISDNILGVLWSKLTYTCLGYFGSLADASLATSCADEKSRRTLADFFAEVVAVGEAKGVRWIKLAEYIRRIFTHAIAADKRLAAINDFAKTWKPDDRRGPFVYVQKKIRTEVDFTLGYVVKEVKSSVCECTCNKVLETFRELEAGKRQFGQHNYDELVTTAR